MTPNLTVVTGVQMATRKLCRGEWDKFCSFASKYVLGKRAHIERLSLRKGSRLGADGVPIQQIFFDPDRDVIEIWAAETPYRIYRPREIYADDVMAGLAHFAVIDSEEERHIVVISEPLIIAAPPGDLTASEAASHVASRDSGAFEDSQFSDLDQKFIERQYRYLTQVHAALVADADGLEIDESGENREKQGVAAELEDDGQRLAQLEIDGALVARDITRLNRVRRALQKIAEHTYGISDASGQPIARARLEAVPEATLTLTEELSSESANRGLDAPLASRN
jgi:DnaK suppressor protein